MAMDRANLQKFYEQTHYTVLLEKKPLTFHIGKYDAAQDTVLRQRCGVTRDWVIITPYNPSSNATDEDANHSALMRLRRELNAASLTYFNSVNQSPEGEWHELGFLVVDPDLAVIKAAARHYRQNAFVAAKLGQAPQLVWMI